MKRDKVGDTIPEITREESLNIHPECGNTHLTVMPGHRINRIGLFTYKWYSISSWTCLYCKWKGEEMKTRTK